MGCFTDICGDWNDEPATTKGQCTPRRLKSDCGLSAVYANEPQTVAIPCPDGTLGETVSYTVAAGAVSSPFSVAAANATALAQAQAAAEALRAASPCVYESTEQSCTDTCPEGYEGDPISVTIPAGAYTSSVSQEAADAAALAEACAQVAILRAATPCTLPPEPPIEGFSLWGWGENANGRLGMGTTVDQYAPAPIDYAPEYVNIALGGNFGLGIKGDGSLWSWGDDGSGQLGIGPTELYSPDVDLVTSYTTPIRVGTDSDWAMVSAGSAFAIGIKTDGSMWSWGQNGESQLGHGDADNRYMPTQIGAETTWAFVDCGGDAAYAIKTDGTLWHIGDSLLTFGASATTPTQVGVATDWSTLSCANEHVMAIKTNGTLWTMGENDLGELGVGDSLPRSSMTQVGVATWSKVSTGSGFTIGIQTNGTMWSWGWNTSGTLGLGNTTNYNTPQQVGVLNTWSNIKCGQFFAVGRQTDGTLWTWGEDNVGQLGQGTPTGQSTSPIQVGSDEFWDELFDCGNDSTIAIRTVTTDPAAPATTNGVAFGGVFSQSGGYDIHTFPSSHEFVVYADTLMEWLVVGGGGGGGGIGGGGGGQVSTGSAIVPAGTYAVAVGAAGLRRTGPGNRQGGDGGTSSFNGTTASGGGGGGGWETTALLAVGRNGASGGGGGQTGSTNGAGGTGTSGGSGGSGVATVSAQGIAGGGGGGAGGAGLNGSGTEEANGTGGTGGAGTTSSISGAATIYGAGGGGGGWTTSGIGGSTGVGGKGGNFAEVIHEAFTFGRPNTGSGGGGGFGDYQLSGQGAVGVVIIRYLTPP